MLAEKSFTVLAKNMDIPVQGFLSFVQQSLIQILQKKIFSCIRSFFHS